MSSSHSLEMAVTKTTPKRSKSKPVENDNNIIHPLTPNQTHEPPSIPTSSLGSASLPRRSLRLANISISTGDSTGTGVRVSNDPNPNLPGSDSTKPKGKGKRKNSDMLTKSVELNDLECEEEDGRGKGFLNLRSGKKVLKKGMGEDNTVENRESRDKTRKVEDESKEELEKENLVVIDSVDEMKLGSEFDMQKNVSEEGDDNKRGKRKLSGTSSQKGHVSGNVSIGSSRNRRSLSRAEKGKAMIVENLKSCDNGCRMKTRKEEDEFKEELEKENLVVADSVDEVKLGSQFEMQKNVSEEGDNKRGKRKLSGTSSQKGHVNGNVGEGSSRRRLSREEKGKSVIVDGDLLGNVVGEVELGVESEMKDSDVNRFEDNVALQDREPSRYTDARENGSRRNRNMERFRDIARENASRFAYFSLDGSDDDQSSPQPEVEPEIEDWPGPFSTAMKIIRDRGMKSVQTGTGGVSSERSLAASIKWVPKMNGGQIGEKFLVPSLQELCLNILAKNVDAIVSLDSVPDALRHKLSQLLCDSRKINGHFFELLVGGSPTEIRLRDCSWLTEEQFTTSFQMCDTANLVMELLPYDRKVVSSTHGISLLPMLDYVLLATLAQSPRHLPRLTSLSLRAACRLSDGGLRALISSAPALRSINLSQCSLLTSSSVYILAESLKSLLKELYLDDCQGIDAALIVPALMELEHLEVLSVAGIQTVCDEFVKDYIIARGHNMKELVLKGCINLTDASMKAIAEHCPGLCVLDLTNLCKLTDLSIGYLTNGCRALHTLRLCRNPFSDEAIAAFVETSGASLKELSLNNVKKVGYHTTLSLASHAKNLHTLDLSWCRNLTDNALGLIVDSCLSLRLLKIFGCTQVTDVFLNGHSNLQIQIIGFKMSPVLQHVKVPDPHQGALNYSSVIVV